jgi:hypothetical protein
MSLDEATTGQIPWGNGRNRQPLYPADLEENRGLGLLVTGILEFHELLDVWLLIHEQQNTATAYVDGVRSASFGAGGPAIWSFLQFIATEAANGKSLIEASIPAHRVNPFHYTLDTPAVGDSVDKAVGENRAPLCVTPGPR